MRSEKGQSILEYVIVLTVIIAAVAIGAASIKGGVQKNFENANASISGASNRLPK